MSGYLHCAAPMRNGSADSCLLGRLWRKGGVEGGVLKPVPSVMEPWWPPRREEKKLYEAQCRLATGLSDGNLSTTRNMLNSSGPFDFSRPRLGRRWVAVRHGAVQ